MQKVFKLESPEMLNKQWISEKSPKGANMQKVSNLESIDVLNKHNRYQNVPPPGANMQTMVKV